MNFELQEIQNEFGAMHLQIMALAKQLIAMTKERDELKKQLEQKPADNNAPD